MDHDGTDRGVSQDAGGRRRVLVTGSTTGLGALAARSLLDDGHEVVLHARNAARLDAVADLADRAVGVVVGDLARRDETHAVADQARAVGSIHAVIHNAGIYTEGTRAETLAVNVLAPYVLTARIPGPARLVYLSSGMHRSGNPDPSAFAWTSDRRGGSEAYCDSKLYVTALAMALARRWPGVLANAVDPGWVPTRMGGRGAPDDLDEGHRTQTWLAVGDEPLAATTTGGYWYHRQRQTPAAAASDPGFQSRLLEDLERVTGVALPSSATGS
jgi:NAD(P)-dependent dehydrogenase (short-subunit alcohol dehydrogenase family)